MNEKLMCDVTIQKSKGVATHVQECINVNIEFVFVIFELIRIGEMKICTTIGSEANATFIFETEFL